MTATVGWSALLRREWLPLLVALVGGVLLVTILAATALTWYVSVNSAGEVTDLRGSHKEQWRI